METKMKYTLLSAAVAIGIFSFAANTVKADAADDAINYLSSGIPDGAKKQLCSKGKGFSNVSLRSGEGNLARVEVIAAIGEVVCGKNNIEGYNKSQFHELAVKTLGGKQPEEVIKGAINNASSAAFKLFCDNKGSLPDVLKVVAKSCPAN